MENNLISEKLSKLTRHPVSISIRLAVLLAIVGGFLDSYTYIDRGGVFANAQTGNIVLLGVSLAEKSWLNSLIYIFPIIAFILGVFVSNFIKNSSLKNSEEALIILEIIILGILVVFPDTFPDNIVNIVISFIASVQVSTFRKLVNSPYCSTMCTGNLRSASDALFEYIDSKDKATLKKFFLYLIVIFTFISGAILGAVLTMQFSSNALLFCIFILLLTLLLFFSEKITK